MEPHRGQVNRRVLWAAVIAAISANLAIFVLRQTVWKGAEMGEKVSIEPLAPRLRLVKTLQGESIIETANRIPEFDDTVWVLGNVESDIALSNLSYRFQRSYVPMLNRVRKTLANPNDAALIPLLLEHFSSSIRNFDDTYRDKNEEIAASAHGVALDRPDKYWSSIVVAPAAAYLLSELNATEALPVFVGALASSDKLPVNRTFLFFASHQLMQHFPQDHISSESQQLLANYLTITGDIPPPERHDVLSWDALYEESDFRFGILRRDIPPNTPNQIVTYYPMSLAMQDGIDDELGPKLKKYVESMVQFVAALKVSR